MESRLHAGAPAAETWGPSPVPAPAAGPAPPGESSREPEATVLDVSLDQMHDAWTRSILPAVRERSIPVATLLSEASPSVLDGDTLTIAFQPGAAFHRAQVDEPKNLTVVRDALYEVTGRRLVVVTTLSDADEDSPEPDGEPAGEENLISLLVSDLNATEVEESP